jgi:hypothetical protein
MKLTNFGLEEPAHSIGLQGLGLYWDLHAFARLIGLEYLPSSGTAELRWAVLSVDNAWGDKSNRATGCLLRFDSVTAVLIGKGENGRDEECVVSISKVTEPNTMLESAEHRVKEEFAEGEKFGLLLELESGGTIEIHAEAATLVALNAAATEEGE